MKLIPLTQGQEAIVDDWWYDYLMQWKWYARWDKHTLGYYANRCDITGGIRKNISMHRVVAKTPDGMDCDHIHHNTLDNRESELRNVTNSQNAMNKRLVKNNTTGVTGVMRNGGNYKAQLMFQGRYVLNKTFKTIEEATKARKEAEKKYFGEFAKTKF